jgi:putative polyhydroxyalkanoate system protein
MIEISMTRSHPFGKDDVRKRIEEFADKVGAKLGGSWRWDGDEVVCEARGARARVGYSESEVHIEIRLPAMMRPLRGRLEAKLDEYFERLVEKR